MMHNPKSKWYRSYLASAIAMFAWTCAALLALAYSGSNAAGILAWGVLALIFVGAGRTLLRGVRVGADGITYRGFLRTRQIPWKDIEKVEFEEVDEVLVFPVFAPVITVVPHAAIDHSGDVEIALLAAASYSVPFLKQRTAAWRAYEAINKGLKSVGV
jgi:hypothetical protein